MKRLEKKPWSIRLNPQNELELFDDSTGRFVDEGLPRHTKRSRDIIHYQENYRSFRKDFPLEARQASPINTQINSVPAILHGIPVYGPIGHHINYRSTVVPGILADRPTGHHITSVPAIAPGVPADRPAGHHINSVPAIVPGIPVYIPIGLHINHGPTVVPGIPAHRPISEYPIVLNTHSHTYPQESAANDASHLHIKQHGDSFGTSSSSKQT